MLYKYPVHEVHGNVTFQDLRSAPRHPRPVLWTPDGADKLLDASLDPPNLANGLKNTLVPPSAPQPSLRPWHWEP